MTFTFSEKDLRVALEANGWAIGWGGEDFPGGDWVPPDGNPDYHSMSFQKAVESLFYNKNLVPQDMKEFWL
jgi:hypothetical protein